MKDCPTCPDRPKPGTDWEGTACAYCIAQEPCEADRDRSVAYDDGHWYQHGTLADWQTDDED